MELGTISVRGMAQFEHIPSMFCGTTLGFSHANVVKFHSSNFMSFYDKGKLSADADALIRVL